MTVEQLEAASTAYYSGEPIMTDAEFDAAVSQLSIDDPDNIFLKRVGAPVPGKHKAEHKIPMGSLSNVNNEDEFLQWLTKNRGTTICLSHKLDGSSVELLYRDGMFVQAITRGDGIIGEDVTRNVLLSQHLRMEIDPSITSVRCECLIHIDDWQTYFQGDANPRNSAAGTLRRHDGKNAEHLRFYAFDAISTKPLLTEFHVMSILSRYFHCPACKWSRSSAELTLWCRKQAESRSLLSYEIDGVVAKIDTIHISRDMGVHNNRPRGQVAVKFEPRGGETVLRKVVWQVGHTGALTPVGEVDPVGVGGTTISRVTLCNMNEISRLCIAIGDIVEVVRAGDVIPKLSKLVRPGDTREIIQPPKKCPECGSKTAKDGARLFCTNDECSGRSFGRVMTWIKKRNILNVGEGVIKAAEIDLINELYFDWTLGAWAGIEVGNGILGEKRAKKVMKAIDDSRKVSLPDFLGSIGIKGVGRSLCRILCTELGIKTIDDVFITLPEDIEQLEGFGNTRAYDFCNWISEHREEIENLATFMNFTEEHISIHQVFSGETICFTGKSPKPRSEMSDIAIQLGAYVSNSITNSVTILVIPNTNSTSKKVIKAKKLGVRMMSPEEFLKMGGN